MALVQLEYCQKGECTDHIFGPAFVDKKLMIDYIKGVSKELKAHGPEIVKSQVFNGKDHV